MAELIPLAVWMSDSSKKKKEIPQVTLRKPSAVIDIKNVTDGQTTVAMSARIAAGSVVTAVSVVCQSVCPKTTVMILIQSDTDDYKGIYLESGVCWTDADGVKYPFTWFGRLPLSFDTSYDVKAFVMNKTGTTKAFGLKVWLE